MKIKSIQCKQCAAPLSLHGGGHRIRSLTCEYCGAIMDVRKDYALLGQFKEQPKPACPITIGAEGKIKGVEFIVIGVVASRSNYGDSWVDLHLFSDTHGYAWLTYQLGHFTFTRKVRDIPDRDMSRLSPHSRLRVSNRSYQFLEAYQSEITYVAGELTWVAKTGDTSLLRDAIAPPFMFTQEVTENELEYHLTEYLDPEDVENNFELDFKTHRSFIHPAQPFIAPVRKALSRASLIPLGLSLLLLVLVSFLNTGNTIFSEKISQSQIINEVYTRRFQVTHTKHLLQLKFNNSFGKNFQVKDIAIFDENREVFSFGNALSRYPASTDNQLGSAQFSVSNKGAYTVKLRSTTLNQSTRTTEQQPSITLEIRQGIIGNRYLKYLLYFSLISFLLFHISQYLFEKKRWN